ncbi:MAG: response regulator transcription factor [Chloroflexota bacterium]|nr:response regulator transcription factor [Chloroflexota bacterium]
MKAKILIADDEPKQVRSFARILEQEGYEVVIAEDDREALYLLDEFQPDLMVLDIRFGYDERMGLDILREIRELRNDKTTPIIILTGLSGNGIEVRSFKYGAIDFVRKSISTEVLLARVKARLPHAMREPIVDECIEIDLYNNSAKVKRDGEWQKVHFERKEFQLLKKLVCNPGRVITRQILEDLFPNAKDPANTLNRYICELRRRLEPDPRHPQYILTEPGVGYRFKDYR